MAGCRRSCCATLAGAVSSHWRAGATLPPQTDDTWLLARWSVVCGPVVLRVCVTLPGPAATSADAVAPPGSPPEGRRASAQVAAAGRRPPARWGAGQGLGRAQVQHPVHQRGGGGVPAGAAGGGSPAA